MRLTFISILSFLLLNQCRPDGPQEITNGLCSCHCGAIISPGKSIGNSLKQYVVDELQAAPGHSVFAIEELDIRPMRFTRLRMTPIKQTLTDFFLRVNP
jgi:hypothetical protein